MHFNVLIKIKCLETLRSISSSDSVSLGDPLMLVFGLCLQGSHPCSEDASKGSTVGQGSLARDTLWAGQCSRPAWPPRTLSEQCGLSDQRGSVLDAKGITALQLQVKELGLPGGAKGHSGPLWALRALAGRTSIRPAAPHQESPVT